MRVELHSQEGVLGEVTLADGVAVPSNAVARETMEGTKISLPGSPPELVRPEDGERYLKGLAVSLRGSYFWAKLIP